MKNYREDKEDEKNKYDRRDFFRFIISGVAGTCIFPLSHQSHADSVYYSSVRKINDSKNPAYIRYNDVALKSKYYKELPKSDSDPDYYRVLNRIYINISDAIKKCAFENNYDVVVEMNDPEIKGYVDITSKVIEKLKEIE
ncbi:MAG: OmpH family outer membrane protein [Candidatus Pacearchaeota archaeon]